MWTRTYNFQKWKSLHHPKLAYLDSCSTVPIAFELHYESGEKYSGTVLAGMKDGKGILVEASSGLTYNGDFANDLKHGSGTLSSEGMDFVYDGQWVNGIKHGHGQLITPEFKYSGDFKNNEFHGQGVH